MRAAFVMQPGPPESITVGELPNPRPTGRQALVQVRAASVNPIDTYIRSGTTGAAIPAPYVVGSDLAGVVKELGPDARRLQVGQRVWGANQGILGRQGTFSELVAIDEEWLYPTPDDVSDEQAAATALVGITASLGLVEESQVKRGETVLVSGGSGGVGSTVVQMSQALGARVIATTGGPEKAAYVRSLGADETIDYRAEDVAARVTDEAPGGVNVWWETSRNVNLDLAINCLAIRGRLILMAGRTARPELPVGAFYTKGCRILGFSIFNYPPDVQRRAAEQINRWLSSGALKTKIDRVGSLANAAEFHRLQEQNTIDVAGVVRGKLVIKFDS